MTDSGNPTNLTRRTESVVFYQDDDENRLKELREAAERVKPDPKARVSPRTLDEPDPAELYAEATRAHDDFKDEATTRAVVVVVQALRRKAWRSLVAEHKPVEGVLVDESLGVNAVTFSEALVPVSIAEPAFTPDGLEEFLGDLSDGQYDQIFWAAWRANRLGASDPKERLSNGTPTSVETSS